MASTRGAGEEGAETATATTTAAQASNDAGSGGAAEVADGSDSTGPGALAGAGAGKDGVLGDGLAAGKDEKDPTEEILFDIDNLFGVERVNHGDPSKDFEWSWPSVVQAWGEAHEEERDEDNSKRLRKVLRLHLANGKVHLMAQHVWQSALTLTEELCASRIDVRGKNVLELGAGAALPGIASRRLGANMVVITDYPDPAIVANMERNVAENELQGVDCPAIVAGYAWGEPIAPLLEPFAAAQAGSGLPDVVLMADTLWLENQHDNLLETCRLLVAAAPDIQLVLTFMNHDDGRGVARSFFAAAKDRFSLRQVTARSIAWRQGPADDDSDSDDPDHYGPVYLRVLRGQAEGASQVHSEGRSAQA